MAGNPPVRSVGLVGGKAGSASDDQGFGADTVGCGVVGAPKTDKGSAATGTVLVEVGSRVGGVTPVLGAFGGLGF